MKNQSKVDKTLFTLFYIGIALIFTYTFIVYKFYPTNWWLNPLFLFLVLGLLLSVISLVIQIGDKKAKDFLILILMIIGIGIYFYREGIYIWF